jgi:gamma-glutamylcysteine synthetase
VTAAERRLRAKLARLRRLLWDCAQALEQEAVYASDSGDGKDTPHARALGRLATRARTAANKRDG